MIQCSVIIPNYNHAAFLEQRIETVLAQTLAPAEIILLDDCSTDNSRAIIEKYRQHPLVSQIIYNEQNSGSPFIQWKKGIALAKYDWIWIAESDDYCDSEFLEVAAKYINAHSKAGLFYCDSFLDYGPLEPPQTFSAIKGYTFDKDKWHSDYQNSGIQEIKDCLGISCTINNVSSAVMKKELLLPHLDDISSFRYHGDWYCYLAILLKSDIVYAARALNHFRCYSSGVQKGLPDDGRHREECFRIFSFLYPHYPKNKRKEWMRRFTERNLSTGLISGRKTWMGYFKIAKGKAFRVVTQLVRSRISSSKNKPS